jgi:ElaB/YqjD/DUF883 family membrane-anchored ribosome-binding protein
MNHSDDQVFDDLHQGVFALRKVVESEDISLSKKAVETLERLETAVPAARNQWEALKQSIKSKALQAAKKTDQIAKEYPWTFALSALGLGLLTGLLLSNSDSDEAEY